MASAQHDDDAGREVPEVGAGDPARREPRSDSVAPAPAHVEREGSAKAPSDERKSAGGGNTTAAAGEGGLERPPPSGGQQGPVSRAWGWLLNRSAVFKALGATLAAAAAAVAILNGFGVLGSDNSTGDAQNTPAALAAALGHTEDAGSSRVQARIEWLDRRERPHVAKGLFDYRRRTGHLRFDESDVIYDGDHAFFRTPDFRHGAWQRLPQGSDPLGPFEIASDPSQQLQYLRGLADVQEVGDESVFGVPTTHYAGAVKHHVPSRPQIPANASPQIRQQIEQAWPQIRRQLLATSIFVDAWIDANGLVRRLQSTTTLNRKPTVQITVDLWDFGVRVPVRPPTHFQVLKIRDLQRASP
jgi:hypothetical protein